MGKAIAKVKLAPGNVAWYDSLTNIYITLESPEAFVYEGDDLTNIKEAIRHNCVLLKEGTFPSLGEVQEIEVEEKVEELQQEVKDEVVQQEEKLVEEAQDEVEIEVQQEVKEEVKEEIIVETKSKGKRKQKKEASKDIEIAKEETVIANTVLEDKEE